MTDAQLEVFRKGLLANCSCSDDRASIEKMSKSTLTMLAQNKKKDKDDDDDDDDDAEHNAGADLHSFDGAKPGSTTQAGGKGVKEEYEHTGNVLTKESRRFLRNATPQIREMITNQIRDQARAKHALVSRLVVNIADDNQRNLIGNRMMRDNSLEDLQVLVAALPTANAVDGDHRPIFIGNGGGPPSTKPLTDNEKQEILPLPTTNWKQIREDERAEEDARAARRRQQA